MSPNGASAPTILGILRAVLKGHDTPEHGIGGAIRTLEWLVREMVNVPCGSGGDVPYADVLEWTEVIGEPETKALAEAQP